MLILCKIHHPNLPIEIAQDECKQLVSAIRKSSLLYFVEVSQIGHDSIVSIDDTGCSAEFKTLIKAFADGFLASRHLWER